MDLPHLLPRRKGLWAPLSAFLLPALLAGRWASHYLGTRWQMDSSAVSVWVWSLSHASTPLGRESLFMAGLILGVTACCGWIVYGARRPQLRDGSGLHGSSRLASLAEVEAAGFLEPRGVTLGYWGKPEPERSTGTRRMGGPS